MFRKNLRFISLFYSKTNNFAVKMFERMISIFEARQFVDNTPLLKQDIYKKIIEKVNQVRFLYDDLKLPDLCEKYPSFLTTPITIDKSWCLIEDINQIKQVCANRISLGGYLLYRVTNQKNRINLSRLIARYSNEEDTTPYAVLLINFMYYHSKYVLQLLSYYDVNKRDAMGRTLLYYCDKKNCETILQNYPYLDLNHQDQNGQTFVHNMISEGHTIPFKLLEEYDFHYGNLFKHACQYQRVDFLCDLITFTPKMLCIEIMFEYLSEVEIQDTLNSAKVLPDSTMYQLVLAADIQTLTYSTRITKLTAVLEYLLTRPQRDEWLKYTDEADNNVLHLLAERHLKQHLRMICSVCKELPLHQNNKGQSVGELYSSSKLEKLLFV